jgi:hypothetical protein
VPEREAWLRRVQHDLVKRVVWPARDRREMGGSAAPGELRPRLVDDEGNSTTAAAVWEALCGAAPAQTPAAALDEFGRSVETALAAAERDDVAGVLGLEAAFRTLGAALRAGR